MILEYQEIAEYHNGHHSNGLNRKSIHDISSSESTEYGDVQIHTSSEEAMYSSVNFCCL